MNKFGRNFNSIEFMKQIVSFSPRQYKGEINTANFLEKYLQKRNIAYKVQKFKTTIPIEQKAFLKADNKNIECKANCFVSGKISNNDNILSSLVDYNYTKLKYNININQHCKSISLATFYNYPSVAISPKDLNKIMNAKKVEGHVKIKPVTYIARNILVGNTINPKTICLAHYDCHLTGAWDNAGGVSTIMGSIIMHPETLQHTLYVFTANEEISYDKPNYWCKGTRCFEEKYLNLLETTKKIIVIDGVGICKSYWMTKYENLESTILIKNLIKFMPKIKRLGASTSLYAQHIYHSDLDTMKNIKDKYILQTIKELNIEINS